MSRLLCKVSIRIALCLVLVVATLGLVIVQPTEPAWGNQKSITFTGTLDCGRRDGARCTIDDMLSLWTEDIGGMQRVTIDVTWIRDTIPSVDQGDYLCIEVFEIDGIYQGVGFVPCKSADKVKKPQEKDDPIPGPTPTVTPTPPPGTVDRRVVIDIEYICVPASDTGILIASVPGSWGTGGGSAFLQPSCRTLEGDVMSFLVTLRSSINEQVTVQFDTEDIPDEARGGALCSLVLGIDSVDYIDSSQTVIFPPNVTTQIVDVFTCPDEDVESDEGLRGVLSSPSSNARIGIGSDIGIIEDDPLDGE